MWEFLELWARAIWNRGHRCIRCSRIYINVERVQEYWTVVEQSNGYEGVTMNLESFQCASPKTSEDNGSSASAPLRHVALLLIKSVAGTTCVYSVSYLRLPSF